MQAAFEGVGAVANGGIHLAEGAIQIVTHPGMNTVEIAQMVIKELVNYMAHAPMSAQFGNGTRQSAFVNK